MRYTKEAFKTFAQLHPIECYKLNQRRFCNYMKKMGYNLTNNEIKQLINSCK